MRLKILQLRSSAGLFGADRVVLALNGALDDAGIDSGLLCINNYRMQEQALHQAATDRRQDAALLPCRRRIDLATIARLAGELRRRGTDIVHVHDYKSAFYAWLATRGQAVRCVATMHGQVDGTRSLRLYNRIELALLRHFDALVAVSARQVEALGKAGVPGQRIHLIDNAIEWPSPSPLRTAEIRRELGLDHGQFVFAAVARFSPEKNLGLLVDAFAAVAEDKPDSRLLLVGDGPDASGLRQQVHALGLERHVHFTGLRDDMEHVYPLFDCLVLPSLTEGMPLVVLEAMAHAIPVIASDVGEIPRLLAQTEHGQLIPPADRDALVAAMRNALLRRGQRDARARRHVETHHSPAAMAVRHAALYRSLTESVDEPQAA
ncbi:glycosyltransferase [Marilutibacter alkalisoli]|uniref:glycosyltransferase n=1 Tax=Marilutibacter alkalisoli TaxID=2591633 RepID=UPI00141D8E87|nr:glycosyltransferase [Lysobacter alkalisoli]